MTIDVYMIDDAGGFQVDCPDGASYTYSPSRMTPGHVEVRERWQPAGTVSARDALISGILAATFQVQS